MKALVLCLLSSLALAQEPDAGRPVEEALAPFAFADFSWAPGNYAAADRPLTWGPFAGEIRVDAVYHHSFSNPADNTISGSSEVFRHGEVQVTQLGFGGDVNYQGTQARLMTQFGMYSQTTPRNDASTALDLGSTAGPPTSSTPRTASRSR